MSLILFIYLILDITNDLSSDSNIPIISTKLQLVYDPGCKGIRNLGNTCFLNSILQCLCSTKKLVEYFLKNIYKHDLNHSGGIADEFFSIANMIWSLDKHIITPSRIKTIIGEYNKQFISNDQQDSQEVLHYLLDALHDELNKVKI
jgi:ubiquitin C-terminal hydrolase